MPAVEVKGRKGKEMFAIDEHPKPKSTRPDFDRLKPVFKEDGVVTAGNASGISDGAGSYGLTN